MAGQRVEVYAAEIGERNTTQEVRVRTQGATVHVMAFTDRKNGHDDFTTVNVHADDDAEMGATMVTGEIVAYVGDVRVFLTQEQAAALCAALWKAGKAVE